MHTHFAILGDGAWGTAIALLLAANPTHRVILWSAREDNGRLLQERRENVRLLPGVLIPPAVELTLDIERAVSHADVWISAIPTIYLRPTLSHVQSVLLRAGGGRIPIVSLTKGVENETFLRPSEILADLLGNPPIAILSGPSHAEEVSRRLPTSVVTASTSNELACWVQRHFSTERFRVYTNEDPIGVELGGALKNIIGIAAGICQGLQFGDNALSALLTRGLVEMTRFGVSRGAQAHTFAGLAGLGDLLTTCLSRHGRNRHVGERLALGDTPAAILAHMTKVAEGVYTTRSVHERAVQLGLHMPITTEIYQVLYEGKTPQAAVSDLLLRAPAEEGWPT
jgi:glycerol-3-phosphate dehydrogenase (NAD(P)+)